MSCPLPGRSSAGMYVARLICSDEACATQALAEARVAGELETLVCDCGCAHAIIAWPDHSDDPLSDPLAVHPIGALAPC